MTKDLVTKDLSLLGTLTVLVRSMKTISRVLATSVTVATVRFDRSLNWNSDAHQIKHQ